MNAAAAVLLVAVLAALFWLGWRSKPPAATDAEAPAPQAPAAPAFSLSMRLAGGAVALLEAVVAALVVLAVADWLGYPLNPALLTYWGAWALVGLRRPDWILAPFTKGWRRLVH